MMNVVTFPREKARSRGRVGRRLAGMFSFIWSTGGFSIYRHETIRNPTVGDGREKDMCDYIRFLC